jgi:type VI secretion system protein ImpA
MQGYLAKRGYVTTTSEEGAMSGIGDSPQTVAAQPISGEIRSTQDVLQALEKICHYYERNEPSSPIPLLLRRAQRLVSKNFMDIIRELVPEASSQIENISGLDGGTAEG